MGANVPKGKTDGVQLQVSLKNPLSHRVRSVNWWGEFRILQTLKSTYGDYARQRDSHKLQKCAFSIIERTLWA